jgi:hypothetical protein
MVVTPQKMYLFGHAVTDYLPQFIKRNLGKSPDEFVDSPPPTFFLIGCSNDALVARGNQSGGIAIWRRLPQDIGQVAYLDDDTPSSKTTTTTNIGNQQSPGLI